MWRLASIVFLPLGLETDTEWPGVWRTGAQVVLRYWSTEDKAKMPKVQWVGGRWRNWKHCCKACGKRVAGRARRRKETALFPFLLPSNHPGLPPRKPNQKQLERESCSGTPRVKAEQQREVGPRLGIRRRVTAQWHKVTFHPAVSFVAHNTSRECP